MKVGLTISVAGHLALIAVASGVGMFTPPQTIPEMTSLELDVEIISEQDFVSQTTPVPEVFEPLPNANSREEETLQPMTEPQLVMQVPEIEPQTLNQVALPKDVSLPQPQTLDIPQFSQPKQQSIVFSTPVALPESQVIKIPEINRVTSEFNPVPNPEIKIADLNQAVIKEVPTPEPEIVPEKPPVATAKKASSPVISTEANQAEQASAPQDVQKKIEQVLAAGAPLQRPNFDTTDTSVSTEIQELIEQVVQAPPQLPTQSTKAFVRKTLTAQEQQLLTNTIKKYWNLGSLSREAQRIVLHVEFQIDIDGTPFGIEMKSYKGGSKASAEIAFKVAQRAIIRGLGDGLSLPIEKYESWKRVSITFDPATMRTR